MGDDYVKLKEIKPELTAYIKESRLSLLQTPAPGTKEVHDIRVYMKKSRAVMKIISGQLEDDFYKRQYETYREIGQRTSSWRDNSVHRKILKNLKKKYPGIFSNLTDRKDIDRLLQKASNKQTSSQEVLNEIKIIDDNLNKAGFRLRFQNMNDMEPKILVTELEKSFNLVVDSYLSCRNNTKPEKVHTFRKRAKDLLYQLCFFRPLNPPAVRSLEKKLDDLTRNLGKYNDMSQLILCLNYKYKKKSSDPALDELMVLIREEQDKYLSKVWPVARKIFRPGQKLVNILSFRILIL